MALILFFVSRQPLMLQTPKLFTLDNIEQVCYYNPDFLSEP
jgi:hypothetical protein